MPTLHSDVASLCSSDEAETAGIPRAYEGRRVGRYRLIEPLGMGAQATVWRALVIDAAPRQVALKILKPARQAEPRSIARLRREADRGKRLQGPSVLPTLEFGIDDGLVFLAMPLVVGCSLHEVIAARRLGPDRPDPPPHPLVVAPRALYLAEAVRVLSRIARTVHEAHAAGVAHRDIKPSNIMLEREEPCRVFLSDFGLARDLDSVSVEQLRDGEGTPVYMAPEKIQRRQTDECRCDVYALGVTLFEALTLERFLDLPPGLSSVVLLAYLSHNRPRRAPLRLFRLPKRLEKIIQTATQEDPSHRFATAAALADELESWLIQGGYPLPEGNPLDAGVVVPFQWV